MTDMTLPAFYKPEPKPLSLAALQGEQPKNLKKLKAIAQDFEAQFLGSMFNEMVSQLQGDGPLGNEGVGADTFRGMLTDEIGKSVAKSGGIGLAPSVLNEMIKLQNIKDKS